MLDTSGLKKCHASVGWHPVKYFIFLILFMTTIAYAQTPAQPDKCTPNLKVGIKAWQLVSYCGKPADATTEYVPSQNKKEYTVYQYILNQTICYYEPAKDQIICTKVTDTPVTLYFNNNYLHKIDLGKMNVADLFLKFNQKIVLGDSEKHVEALWGQPKQKSTQTLSIPALQEKWQYPDKKVILTDGVVSSINDK